MSLRDLIRKTTFLATQDPGAGATVATVATVCDTKTAALAGNSGGAVPLFSRVPAVSAFPNPPTVATVATVAESSMRFIAAGDPVPAFPTKHSVSTVATVATVAEFSAVFFTQKLPQRLVTAAVNVCREIHGDDEPSIQEMLADLLEYPPDVWDQLIHHFEQQLVYFPESTKSQPIENKLVLVTCRTCENAEFSSPPGIAHCRAGVDPGGVLGGYWADDRHTCLRHIPPATVATLATLPP